MAHHSAPGPPGGPAGGADWFCIRWHYRGQSGRRARRAGRGRTQGGGARKAMNGLLLISRAIDALNERVGRVVLWLVLIMVLVSAGNAVSRYLLNLSSNAFLELQWYLFAAVFLFCAGYALKHNEHIRIDVVTGRFSPRTKAWIDVFGTVFFLLPVSLYIMWLSWPIFMNAWTSGEISSNAGGLIRWPARLMIPVGFFLLSLQGVSELIKRIAFLRGLIPDPAEKHVEPALQIIRDDAEVAK
jgi:TRAP-type mannitol/chloroaromatic compound transport system permease small subunit